MPLTSQILPGSQACLTGPRPCSVAEAWAECGGQIGPAPAALPASSGLCGLAPGAAWKEQGTFGCWPALAPSWNSLDVLNSPVRHRRQGCYPSTHGGNPRLRELQALPRSHSWEELRGPPGQAWSLSVCWHGNLKQGFPSRPSHWDPGSMFSDTKSGSRGSYVLGCLGGSCVLRCLGGSCALRCLGVLCIGVFGGSCVLGCLGGPVY